MTVQILFCEEVNVLIIEISQAAEAFIQLFAVVAIL
jgi:hypothetical protein